MFVLFYFFCMLSFFYFFFFFFKCSGAHRDLHSFPTRRLPICLIASGVRTSGFAAPALTPTPTPIRPIPTRPRDRKSTRLNSSHVSISYAVFCLKKKTTTHPLHY